MMQIDREEKRKTKKREWKIEKETDRQREEKTEKLL